MSTVSTFEYTSISSPRAAWWNLRDAIHLQGYDAVYFELARTLEFPLATLDHGHRQAAKVHNVMVFSPT